MPDAAGGAPGLLAATVIQSVGKSRFPDSRVRALCRKDKVPTLKAGYGCKLGLGRRQVSPVVPEFDLRSLTIFVAVCRHGSFTRAAESLEVSTACVSVHVKRLEQSLGARLMKRNSQRMALTPDGDRLLPAAERLLALNAELMLDWPLARSAPRAGRTAGRTQDRTASARED